MNILMIMSVSWPPRDGIGRHIMTLSECLTRRGHTISLMTRGGIRKTEDSTIEGIRVLRTPFVPFYPFHVHTHGVFLRRAITSLSPPPDLVHLHSPLVPPVQREFPLVTTFHSPSYVTFSRSAKGNLPDRLRKWMGRTVSYKLEKRLLQISDEVITVHDRVREDFRRYYSDDVEYHVIPNAVDTDFFRPPPLPVQKKILLFAGRLDYRKGLLELVMSAPAILSKHPDTRFALLGSGPFRQRLEREVAKRDLQAHFAFLGEITDPAVILRQYQESYAVIHPSYAEGSPLAILEAMACGKPIIAAASGFEQGLLEDEENALLVPPASADELASAALRLLSSPELAGKIGRAARKKAVESMDVRAATDKVEEIYRRAVERWRSSRRTG
jgi:glycosyltransferase involved in cell wall biosynthesis